MKTLIIIKPDWVENKELIYELSCLILRHGLEIHFSKKALLDVDFWKEFYISHIGADYFEEMIQWLSSSPSIFLMIKGDDAINLVRWKIVGKNGSGIRGKYQINELKNVAHASDSEESAERELSLVRHLFR